MPGVDRRERRLGEHAAEVEDDASMVNGSSSVVTSERTLPGVRRPRPDRRGRHLARLEQVHEAGLVEDRARRARSALVSLDAPGSSPTTTAVVFFDTLPGRLAAPGLDGLLGLARG